MNLYKLSSKFVSADISADLLNKFGKEIPIVICIGSDKVLSDCVGVFVADMLRAKKIKTLVFGGSNFPVLKSHMNKLLEYIKSNYPLKKVLFVDSRVTCGSKDIFFDGDGITLSDNKFYGGASITAGTMVLKNNKLLLSNTRLKDIVLICETICNAICDYAEYLKLLKSDMCIK